MQLIRVLKIIAALLFLISNQTHYSPGKYVSVDWTRYLLELLVLDIMQTYQDKAG
jgi:hypothetical protein